MITHTPIIFHPKDYFKIFPHLTSESWVYQRYSRLKKKLGKQRHQFITVEELAAYEGIPVQTIQERLQ